MMIEYQAGNEHSPMERDGRVTLGLDLDGTVEVRHHAWFTREVGSWSTRIDPAVARAILAAVQTAGIPHQPSDPPAPDSYLRTLHVAGLGSVILAGDPNSATGPHAVIFDRLHALASAVIAGPSQRVAVPEPPPNRA